MKITVLNGSPKGDDSVTLHYVKYIAKKYPQHQFVYLNISQSIKKLEKDESFFKQTIDAVKGSDGVIWAFPLYVFMVHANYKRFIELIWERNAQDAFKDKYTASIATSIHFFDHTALNYIHSICDDLNMRYVDFFSAAMDDLTKEPVRNRLIVFAHNFFESIDNKICTSRTYRPIENNIQEYVPGEISAPIDTKEQKIVVVTDSAALDRNIGRMVERLRKLTQADLIDISAIDIKGGCTGCIQCGFDNQCIYGDRDDIETVYGRIGQYDIIVFAGAIRDRYLSARWKLFIDRRFFKTHQPQFAGKQIGYLISGPLSQIHNLREIIQANTELDEANLAGILTDEFGASGELDERMEGFAQNLVERSVQKYIRPHTFLGIGGQKIFRDDIWGKLRFVFQGDHRYYKKHGVYDFPQKQYGTRAVNAFMMLLTKIPPAKKNIRQNLRKYMIKPHQAVLKNK